jgi:hypothetical protein
MSPLPIRNVPVSSQQFVLVAHECIALLLIEGHGPRGCLPRSDEERLRINDPFHLSQELGPDALALGPGYYVQVTHEGGVLDRFLSDRSQ